MIAPVRNSFYGDSVAEDLRKEITEFTRLTPEEQYSFEEELAPLKVNLRRSYKRFTSAISLYDEAVRTKSKAIDDYLTMMDSERHRYFASLRDLQVVAEKSLNMRSKAQNQIAINTMMHFITESMRLADEIFNDGTSISSQKLQYYENEVRSVVTLEEEDQNALIPLLEAQAMAGTVPGEVEVSSIKENSSIEESFTSIGTDFVEEVVEGKENTDENEGSSSSIVD